MSPGLTIMPLDCTPAKTMLLTSVHQSDRLLHTAEPFTTMLAVRALGGLEFMKTDQSAEQ